MTELVPMEVILATPTRDTEPHDLIEVLTIDHFRQKLIKVWGCGDIHRFGPATPKVIPNQSKSLEFSTYNSKSLE
jgi:hypothetical protein